MSILDYYKPGEDAILTLASREAEPKYAKSFAPIARGKIAGLALCITLFFIGCAWLLTGWIFFAARKLFPRRKENALS